MSTVPRCRIGNECNIHTKPLAPGVRAVMVRKAEWESLKLLLTPARIGNQTHVAEMGGGGAIGGPHHFSIYLPVWALKELE